MSKTQKTLPLNQAKKQEGYTGTEYYSGYFSEEKNSKWVDSKRIETVKKMRNEDAMVQGTLLALKSPIIGAETAITPYSKDERDVEIAKEIEYQFNHMPFRTLQEFLQEAVTQFEYGHSVFEIIVGMREDGMIYLRDLAPRVQSSIEAWSLADGRPGIRQYSKSTKEWEPDDSPTHKDNKLEYEIPAEKLLIFSNDKEGDDMTGRSVLRSSYIHWRMKNGTYKTAAIGIERTAVGVPTGKLPEGVKVGSDEYNKFAEALQNVRVNEKAYMLMPEGYDWSFVTANGGQLGTIVKDYIDHHDRMIAMSILAEFLTLGANSVGSHALSRDQSGFFLMCVEQKIKYIAEQITRQVIHRLVDYNYSDVEGYPKFEFTNIGQMDFKEMSEVYEKLVNMGLVNFMDSGERNFARKQFKLPVDDSGDDEEEQEEPEEESPKKDDPKQKSKEEKEEGGDDPKDEEEGLALLADQKKNSGFWRPLIEQEKRVDLKFLQATHDEQENKIKDRLSTIFSIALGEALRTKIKRIVKAKNLAALPDITIVSSPQLRKILREAITDSYRAGQKTAAQEVGIKNPKTPAIDTRTINYDVAELANEIKNEFEGEIKRTTKESIIKDVAPDLAAAAVINKGLKKAAQITQNISGFTVGENVNRGRYGVFSRNLTGISGFMRTEILDDRTCNMCLSLDGRIVEVSDPVVKMGAVHSNCRGEWIPLFTEDDSDAELIKSSSIGIPKTALKNFDTIGGVPVINSFTQLKKPVNKANKDVQKEIKRRAKK